MIDPLPNEAIRAWHQRSVGGRNKLAKPLGVTGPYVGRVLSGEKPMAEELAGKVAAIRRGEQGGVGAP
jgi:DNA-binding transcriptional regulator YdaS (Cro superfamily)